MPAVRWVHYRQTMHLTLLQQPQHRHSTSSHSWRATSGRRISFQNYPQSLSSITSILWQLYKLYIEYQYLFQKAKKRKETRSKFVTVHWLTKSYIHLHGHSLLSFIILKTPKHQFRHFLRLTKSAIHWKRWLSYLSVESRTPLFVVDRAKTCVDDWLS